MIQLRGEELSKSENVADAIEMWHRETTDYGGSKKTWDIEISEQLYIEDTNDRYSYYEIVVHEDLETG